MPLSPKSLFFLISAGLLGLFPQLPAQTVWSGNGDGTNYNDADNWDSGLPSNTNPGQIFNATVQALGRNNLDNDTLLIGTGGELFTNRANIEGSSITLESNAAWLSNTNIAFDSGSLLLRDAAQMVNLGADIRFGRENGSGTTVTVEGGLMRSRNLELGPRQAVDFTQSGGTIQTTANLRINGANSQFEQLAGDLSVGNILSVVNGASFLASGSSVTTQRLTLNNNASATFSGNVLTQVNSSAQDIQVRRGSSLSVLGNASLIGSGGLDMRNAGSSFTLDTTGAFTLEQSSRRFFMRSNTVFNHRSGDFFDNTQSDSAATIQGTYNLSGGRYIRTTNLSGTSGGLQVTSGGEFNQTGGEVIIRADAVNEGLLVNQGSTYNLLGGIFTQGGGDANTTRVLNNSTFNWGSGGTIRSENTGDGVIIRFGVSGNSIFIAHDDGGGRPVLNLDRDGSNTGALVITGGGALDLDDLTIDMYDVGDLIPNSSQVSGNPLGVTDLSNQIGIQGSIDIIDGNLDLGNFDLNNLDITNLTGIPSDVPFLGLVNGAAGESAFSKFGASNADSRIRSFAFAEVTNNGIFLRFNVVPEPSSAGMALLAFLTWALRRRRNTSFFGKWHKR